MLRERSNPTVLLVHEDDETAADVQQAARASRFMKDLVVLKGSEALVDYLDRCHPDAMMNDQLPCPNLILFDLKMSLQHAADVLTRVKADEVFKPIPVVVLARPPIEAEYVATYDMGVNAFVNRPDTLEELEQTLQIIENFWLGVVTLPRADKTSALR